MPPPERTASTDVRMRGFTQRAEVPDALAWIDAHTPLLPGESVAVEEAAGRVLLHEVIAPIAVPEFDRSAMDGYALRGGETSQLRPIRPDDAQMLQTLVRGLSPESRYFRFVSSFNELPATMLSRFTLIDYDREMALVAVVRERSTGEDGGVTETDRIVGVSRYVIAPDQQRCEFSLVVAEDMKGKGLGARLMESIMEVARDKGLAEMEGLVLVNNAGMLKLMKSLGFGIKAFAEDRDFRLVSRAL